MLKSTGHINFFLLSLYTLLVVCMGIATVVEKLHGSECAKVAVYGSWWFFGLWISLSAVSVVHLIRQKVYRKAAVALLHLSFIVILAGAFVTHLTSDEGTVHLREGVAISSFTGVGNASHRFPFSLVLEEFNIVYYPGTDAAMDYQAKVVATDVVGSDTLRVSMNNVGRKAGYRLYQSSYDADRKGVVLLVAHDPYGIPVTYAGYLMLLVGMLWSLVSHGTRIRMLYRMATRRTAALLVLVFCCTTAMAQQMPRTVDTELAHEFGTLPVLYNGRVCPLNTTAVDFVTKLCGRSSWRGLTADEIFVGWMIYYSEWESQPVIKVTNREVQRMLGISDNWASVKDFYTKQHEYKLRDKVNDAGLDAAVRKALREADEKIQVVSMFYNSEMLRLFPLPVKGRLQWYTPGSTELPSDVPEAEFQFINHAMDNLVKCLLVDDAAGARLVMAKIKLYQRDKAAEVLPSVYSIRAERALNSLQSDRLAIYFFIVTAFVMVLLSLKLKRSRLLNMVQTVFACFLALYVTILLVLRWWIGGHIPLGNGYETMLFMAWMAAVLTVILMQHISLLRFFGPVVVSLFLLVSALVVGNPQVTPLVPVLQSPLLAIHVAVIMVSYTLLTFIALIALYCLCVRSDNSRLTAVSRLMLYPAVACLGIGIFIGAVWANVSWGSYWSWDPKETWALITMMIYAVPLHRTPLTDKNHQRRYHIYMLVSLSVVVMTYFGVNYLMPGMHSYS